MDVLVIESSPGIAATLRTSIGARRPRSDLVQRLPRRAVPRRRVERGVPAGAAHRRRRAGSPAWRRAEPQRDGIGVRPAASGAAGDPVSGRRVRARSEHRDRRSCRPTRGRGWIRGSDSQQARTQRRRHHGPARVSADPRHDHRRHSRCRHSPSTGWSTACAKRCALTTSTRKLSTSPSSGQTPPSTRTNPMPRAMGDN